MNVGLLLGTLVACVNAWVFGVNRFAFAGLVLLNVVYCFWSWYKEL